MTTQQKRMQKLSRILRKIDDYDYYIHTHYTAQEIMQAFDKGEKKKHYYGTTCGLIYDIWSGADNDIMSQEYEEIDSKEG